MVSKVASSVLCPLTPPGGGGRNAIQGEGTLNSCGNTCQVGLLHDFPDAVSLTLLKKPRMVLFNTELNASTDSISLLLATKGLIPPHLDAVATFVLCKDSYNDTNTDVTYAYFRQFINRLKVADGNLDVNIKEEIILSYSRKFSV